MCVCVQSKCRQHFTEVPASQEDDGKWAEAREERRVGQGGGESAKSFAFCVPLCQVEIARSRQWRKPRKMANTPQRHDDNGKDDNKNGGSSSAKANATTTAVATTTATTTVQWKIWEAKCATADSKWERGREEQAAERPLAFYGWAQEIDKKTHMLLLLPMLFAVAAVVAFILASPRLACNLRHARVNASLSLSLSRSLDAVSGISFSCCCCCCFCFCCNHKSITQKPLYSAPAKAREDMAKAAAL